MKQRSLFLVPLLALLVILAGGASPSYAVLYTGQARTTIDDLTVDVVVTPPISQPGDTVQMVLQASYNSTGRVTPSITVQLPEGLSAGVQDLPAGATYNIQDASITWSPRLDRNNSNQELRLELRVDSVDVLTPEKNVVVVVAESGREESAAAKIWLGIPPLVGEIQTQRRVAVGQPVQLQADIGGPGPIQVTWELGDGRRIEVLSPTLAFASGTQTVTAIVSNPAGTVQRQTTLEVVANPVAAFTLDDETPGVDQTIHFASQSGGQPPLTVSWDFGDGMVSEETNPSHAYTSPGTYLVSQTVENNFGRSEAFWQLTVGLPPVTDISVPDKVKVGQSLLGQAFGDDSVLRYEWDMGDGRGRTGETIDYRYRRSGEYYISMAAINDYGATRVGRWVHVEHGESVLFIPSLFLGVGAEAANLSADVPSTLARDTVLAVTTENISLDPLTFPAGTTPAEKLFTYINEARRQFELGPLAYRQELSNSAQQHSADKAFNPLDPHTGTDGTVAAERLLRHGYSGGYAGEATAWGFSDPREAVEFWLNSDAHRVILLNSHLTDVGVGYFEDYGTQNIWHWTAEFGLSYGAPAQPNLRLHGPVVGAAVQDSDLTNYSWVWPLPLASDQYFAVYLAGEEFDTLLGTVKGPVFGSRYLLSVDSIDHLAQLWPGNGILLNLNWFVRLEDARGAILAESPGRPLFFRQDPETALPLATTVAPTLLPLITATPVGQPSPTVTPPPPTVAPPTDDRPPIIVTATPHPAP